MTNLRDGGRVIIGVDDDHSAGLAARGLDTTQLASWRNYDDVAVSLNQYADPSIRFDLEVLSYDSAHYAILHVHEFESIPILCARDY